MTSASELFYNRRSRIGRNAELDLVPSVDRSLYHRHHRRHRHDEYCNSSPRRFSHVLPHTRHPLHRVSQSERESIRLDLNMGSSTGRSGDAGTSSSRMYRSRITSNDRLPGDVLQARARLLERLRGVSITESNQSRTDAGISWDDFAVSDDFRAVSPGELETDIGDWLTASVPVTDMSHQGGPYSVFVHTANTKPPGLSREAINRLPREVFEVNDEDGVLTAMKECCICLESFQKGDLLICLTCDHKFHPSCLDPWVQVCGDCPYCRTCIVLDCEIQEKPQNSY